MTPDQVQEFIKCKMDVAYFIDKYCKIEHPKKGLIPFKLHQYQQEIAKCFTENRFNIVNKSRQTGISTITASYAVWKAVFHNRQRILIISIKDQDAQSFLDKIRVAYLALPKWMREEPETNNNHELALTNGSIIRSVASGKTAARGQSLSLLIVDEAAFIQEIAEIWKSAYPTLSTGGAAILISTPNGISNFFAKTWDGALEINPPEKRNGFKATFVHWTQVPDYACLTPYEIATLPEKERLEKAYKGPWYIDMRPKFTDKEWAQEFEGDFIGSGNTVIEGKRLKALKELIKEPIRKEGPSNGIWIWHDPVPNHKYVMGIDTATGHGLDNSTFQLFDVNTGQQVAEYQGLIPIETFSQLCFDYGKKYNEAYLIPENTGIGHMTSSTLARTLGYWNIYMTENIQTNKIRKNMYGFSTNMRTRPLLVASVQKFFDSDAWRFYSERLWYELTSFIWNGDKAEADAERRDDLIMALGLAIFNVEAYLRGMPVGTDDEVDNFQEKITTTDNDMAPPPDASLYGRTDYYGEPDMEF